MDTLRTDRRLTWPQAVPVGWFVLVVVASGFITYVQEAAGLSRVPVQTLARLWLVAMVVVALGVSDRRRDLLDRRLRAPLIAFAIGILATLLSALARDTATGEALREFGFVYSTGVLLLLYLVVPIVARFGILFRIFCAICLGFGMLQTYRQDLMLPASFRERFGIVYELFVNDHVRVLGFFASPPRFAELLVLIAAVLQHSMIAGRRRGPIVLGVYALVLFALFNTYSRSGYVLFLGTALIQIVLMRRYFLRGDTASTVRLYALVVSVAGGFGLLISGRLPFDSSVTDTTSLTARQSHWAELLNQLHGLGVGQVLFGTGRSARFSILSSDYFVVDNVVLALFLYGGVVGTVTFLWLFLRIFGACRTAAGSSAEWSALSAFYLALLVEGMFVDNHNTIFVVQFALLGMLARHRAEASAGNAVPVTRVRDAGSPAREVTNEVLA